MASRFCVQYFFPVISCFLMTTLLACSSGGDDSKEPDGQWVAIAEVVIGEEGGHLRSEDDSFSVFFSEGTFPIGTRIKLTHHEPAQDEQAGAVQSALAFDGFLPVEGTRYRLEPLGLQGDKSFIITIRFQQSLLPVLLVAEDLGVYENGTNGWVAAEDTWTEYIKRSDARVKSGASVDSLGEYQVAIHPPYIDPPHIDRLENNGTVISDSSGALQSIGYGPGLISFMGSGFGWDPDVVEAYTDGKKVTVDYVTNRELFIYPQIAPEPETDIERTVYVTVKGRKSNSLKMRVEGPRACQGEIKTVWPSVAPPGTTVNLHGIICGTEKSRRVLVGDVPVAVKYVTGQQFSFVIPPDTPPGITTIRGLDGLGSSPSEPFEIMVLPVDPIELDWEPKEGGMPFVASHSAGGDLTHLRLSVSNLENCWRSHDGHWQGLLEVRFQTEFGDTGFYRIRETDQPPLQDCHGLAGGQCVLPIPMSVLVPLAKTGGDLTVTIRMEQNNTGVYDPEGEYVYVRESNPLTIQVSPKVPSGGYNWVNLGSNEQRGAFCSEHETTFAVGDYVCVHAQGVTEVHRLTSPELFQGEALFGSSGMPGECFLLSSPGKYTIRNETLGKNCTVQALYNPDKGLGGVGYFNANEDIVLASGGARLVIPAGALPDNDGEPYYITMQAYRDPDVSTTDHQRAWDIVCVVKFQPDVVKLNLPISLSMPRAPGDGQGASPEFGIIDMVTNAIHLVKEGIINTAEAILWQLPPGNYSPTAPDAVLPGSLNVALQKVGPIAFVNDSGEIEDPQGRIRVEYVTDKSSADYVDSWYAHAVLDGAVQAYEELQSLGWRLPKDQVRIIIRYWVSWADFTGKASGSTTSGFLGQPVSAISNRLPDAAQATYVTIHEMGHVFQRGYSTNLTLSWLDEAMSEWIAWKVLGDDFPMAGMTEDSAGVLIPTLGIASSWKGYPSDLVYGTVPLLAWISQNYGDNTIRQIYETIEWSPSNWTDAHSTLENVLGLSNIMYLASEFGENFWIQAFSPIKTLHFSALLASVPLNADFSFTQAQTLPITLMGRPPYSSMRYGVRVPTAVEIDAQGGNLVLRSAALNETQRLIVYHSYSLGAEISNDLEEVAVLGHSSPIAVLPGLTGGRYWITDNNFGPTAGNGKLTFELPRISSVTPSPAAHNATVTVNGTHFGSEPGILSVGGQPLAHLTWTDTRVTFKMPEFANTSAVGVVVRTKEDARTNEKFLEVAQ